MDSHQIRSPSLRDSRARQDITNGKEQEGSQTESEWEEGNKSWIQLSMRLFYAKTGALLYK
eukprot:2100537-Rhodomonas_salina.1